MQQRCVSFVIIVLFGVGSATFSLAQTEDAQPKYLTVGDISKIDAKNKSLTISFATSYNIAKLGNDGAGGAPSGRSGGGRGGGASGVQSGGGGRRRGGGRAGGNTSSGGRTASAPIPMDYKVVVSPKTVIKEGESEIKFDDLKLGDRLQVFSMKSGSKLDPSEIIRTPKEER
jgi:hypothetical protein